MLDQKGTCDLKLINMLTSSNIFLFEVNHGFFSPEYILFLWCFLISGILKVTL